MLEAGIYTVHCSHPNYKFELLNLNLQEAHHLLTSVQLTLTGKTINLTTTSPFQLILLESNNGNFLQTDSSLISGVQLNTTYTVSVLLKSGLYYKNVYTIDSLTGDYVEIDL